jgi:hypothetical protein
MKRTRRIILFALLALTAAAWPALLWLQHQYELPENYAEVERGLWMGGDADQPPPGTQAVLNLCEKDDPYRTEVYFWDSIRDAAPAPSIDWLKKKVEWVEAQRAAGRTTYVHCFAGKSRSGMVVAAYLMQAHGWSRDEAIARIREKRPEIKVNAAFMELLNEWESNKNHR